MGENRKTGQNPYFSKGFALCMTKLLVITIKLYFKYCAMQHYSPLFSPATVLQRSRQWTMGGREVASCPAPASLTGHITTFSCNFHIDIQYNI